MPRPVLFGHHPAWLPLIATRLDPSRYAAAFAPLEHVDLTAFDAVLPLGLADYRTLSARSDLYGRRFLHPSPAVAALCDDKLALARFLIDTGFGHHVPPIHASDAPVYPCVRRPRQDEFGRHARILFGPEDETGTPIDEADLFDQAYVPGPDEYVLHAIRHDGRVRFAWALHHRMAGPGLIRGGTHAPVASREIDPRPALAVFAPMLDMLNYSGTCSIDFKLADDRIQVLEINPRFGGSLTLGINAYVDAYLRCLAL